MLNSNMMHEIGGAFKQLGSVTRCCKSDLFLSKEHELGKELELGKEHELGILQQALSMPDGLLALQMSKTHNEHDRETRKRDTFFQRGNIN